MLTLKRLALVLSLTLCACATQNPKADSGTAAASPDTTAAGAFESISPEAALAGLEGHCVEGKVTVFEFASPSCIPCEQLEAHFQQRLGERSDFVVRKIMVEDWDSPLVAKYLANVDSLPYVVVYDASGKRVDAVSGMSHEAVDLAIEDAAAPAAKADEPAEVAEPSVESPKTNYTVAAAPTQVDVDTDATATVVVKPGEGFKINLDFPWQATVGTADGVELTKTEFPQDAWQLEDGGATLVIPFTATSAGERELKTTMTFSVCNESQCDVIRAHEQPVKIVAKDGGSEQ